MGLKNKEVRRLEDLEAAMKELAAALNDHCTLLKILYSKIDELKPKEEKPEDG